MSRGGGTKGSGQKEKETDMQLVLQETTLRTKRVIPADTQQDVVTLRFIVV